MKIEFDPAKSEKNARERGLPFELVGQFDWESAVFWQDMRFDYPESRYIALGLLGSRVHVVCVAPVSGGLRIIGFRKANDREVRKYEKEKAVDR